MAEFSRRALTGVCAAAMLVTATACSGSDSISGLSKTVDGFADALNRDDVQAAAAATSDPAKASAALGPLYDNLGKQVHFEASEIEKTEDGGTFTLAAVWKLGKDGKNEWTYTTSGRANRSGGDWKIQWDPATVAPGLNVGPLSYSLVYPDPAKILDSSGGDLLTQQVVTLVTVAPGADPAAVAAALRPVAPNVTAASLQSDLAAARGTPITAVTLRDSDYVTVQAGLADLANVTTSQQTRLLAVDKSLASPTFSGLSDLWQQQADAAAGWAIRAQGSDGTQRVGGPEPKQVNDIHTTLDIGLQRAAEAALAPITTPAAIVALQPSTGNVLAMAQNAPGDAQGPIGLTGLYPPGSTFKTVTVSAALQAGRITPDSMVACPGQENIEGRKIPNDNNFDLGQVPLHTAFARSCNTTMGRLAVQLAPDALTTAAAQLGLGIDYVTPGLTTVTGKVPAADTPALRVEEGIGQGKVTASPFGMALVAAALAQGTVKPPTAVQGQPGKPDKQPPTLPPGVADQVKSMMRETITGGTATALRDIPGLLGKTGTAEYIDDKHAHGWFVGIDGDLAFAVFVSDAGSSDPAVQAAGRMLRAPH